MLLFALFFFLFVHGMLFIFKSSYLYNINTGNISYHFCHIIMSLSIRFCKHYENYVCIEGFVAVSYVCVYLFTEKTPYYVDIAKN